MIHILIVIILTLLTQIGGVIWIIIFSLYKLRTRKEKLVKRLFAFFLMYVISTFLIVPPTAKVFGRVKLPTSKSGFLSPQTYLTSFLNRNYVSDKLYSELKSIAKEFNEKSDLKVIYLDANFPFFDGFPLLPHLSHNDGKKVDLSFIYNREWKVTNQKPSTTGYGVFVEPRKNETNQTTYCKNEGKWRYDITRYFTLGSIEGLKFNQTETKNLVRIIINRATTQKIFIEPHLKNRFNLRSEKIRFQGCHSVRHDDHIHLQID